jgi:diketogulonate reductase-like aldo/keto reductase
MVHASRRPAGPDSASRKEQWLALEQWALSGKARAIGVSHYCRTHIEEVMSVSAAARSRVCVCKIVSACA